MSILLIGSEGSMGKRYQAIFRRLNKEVWCIDKNDSKDLCDQYARRAQGIVIATPTDTHFKFLLDLIPRQRPILCEKPVTKDMTELEAISDLLWEYETPFSMMYQYSLLANPSLKGPTKYDYFRHGSDGLIWDCLQIIGLAQGEVSILDQSPIWDCVINGEQLALSQMDQAYVDYVRLWMKYPSQDISRIKDAHYKTREKAQNG